MAQLLDPLISLNVETKSQNAVEQALKKLADQLKCSICLNSFDNPKLLQCFHVFCKKCLKPLVTQDHYGRQSVCCPNCRHSTILPQKGIPGLQSAFHIHHLFEIEDALKKVKLGEREKTQYIEKCCDVSHPATHFCRSCGQFICNSCKEVHKNFKELLTHRIISLEELKSNAMKLVPPTKKTLHCSKHPTKELDLYCETEQELICRDCIVKLHRNHQYDLVSEVFSRHKRAFVSQLQPIQQQLTTVNKAIGDLDAAKCQITDQQAAIEADIQTKTEQLQRTVEARKAEVVGQLNQITQQKLKSLSIQRDELVILQTRLDTCLHFVNDCLKTSCEEEILAIKKPVMQQIKDMCTGLGDKQLSPQVKANMSVVIPSEPLPAWQIFNGQQTHATTGE